ncbi:hypothetical protein NHX12_007383 [Muraenolepis orangiensis]|uniref:Uncharacterized protein n=1 Tax=Muraenolepis orangiensis TaxID=630683 RepID=A0A9Q0IBH7_9TELE|nr:hypothetical protein NHX12_007383 [Muraenolepis orangiensis]
MTEPDGCGGDGLCSDGAPEVIPPRLSRGRRSGVVLPGGPDTDALLLETVRAAPRRSSIIKNTERRWSPRPEAPSQSSTEQHQLSNTHSASPQAAFTQSGSLPH